MEIAPLICLRPWRHILEPRGKYRYGDDFTQLPDRVGGHAQVAAKVWMDETRRVHLTVRRDGKLVHHVVPRESMATEKFARIISRQNEIRE